MKIAIPTKEDRIDSHFGHCEYFSIFTIDDQKNITKKEIMASTGTCGCKSNLAQKLASEGINILLTGNIGSGAILKLKEAQINVIRGCQGNINQIIEDFLQDKLKDSEINCTAHEHHHPTEENCQH